MTTGRLFDRIVVAGWSDADVPTRGEESIWRAGIDVSSGAVECLNHATRAQATRQLVAELDDSAGKRIFLGFDFALGFPAGFASRLIKSGANWRAVWTIVDEAVTDGDDNGNNRFDAGHVLNERAGMSPGPFWGHQQGARHSSVLATRPKTFAGLSEFRIAEQRLAARGIETPSVWQLWGDNRMGGRMLLGIPLVRQLAERSGLARRVRIWPFETGCTDQPTRGSADAIVIGEVWPWSYELDPAAHRLPDAARVISTAQVLAEHDRAGRLGPLFAPSVRADDLLAVEREEGWILGA